MMYILYKTAAFIQNKHRGINGNEQKYLKKNNKEKHTDELTD